MVANRNGDEVERRRMGGAGWERWDPPPAAASKPSQCHPGTSDIYIQFLRLSRYLRSFYL